MQHCQHLSVSGVELERARVRLSTYKNPTFTVCLNTTSRINNNGLQL
jgi:hypothetical protein